MKDRAVQGLYQRGLKVCKMFTIEQLQSRFNEIFERAIADHQLETIFVAYSGGTDSATVLELAKNAGRDVRVMTIDTGLSSPGHIEKVCADIKRAGYKPEIFSGAGLDWYVQNVREYGYAYTPNQHVIYYRMLKERAIDDCIRQCKTRYHQRIGFITGVRRQESARRSKTPLVYQRRARVTINAIAEFTEGDKLTVLTGNSWYHGKFTHDCMCNWHGNHTVDETSGNVRAQIIKLNEEMREIGLWCYGQRPSREQLALVGGETTSDDMPVDGLCVNCYKQLRLL